MDPPNVQARAIYNVNVHTVLEDYTEIDLDDMYVRCTPASVPAMADTGCQSCLAGLKVIHRLGLRESDLLPVTMRMHTANNEGIKILGAILLRIFSTDSTGLPVTNRQMTYVTQVVSVLL